MTKLTGHLNLRSLHRPKIIEYIEHRLLSLTYEVLTDNQRIRGFTTMRYINLRFTYLLTYLLYLKCRYLAPLGSVTARHSSSGRQPNFAALNRGRHLYSAGRPSRWALAQIPVSDYVIKTTRFVQVGTEKRTIATMSVQGATVLLPP